MICVLLPVHCSKVLFYSPQKTGKRCAEKEVILIQFNKKSN